MKNCPLPSKILSSLCGFSFSTQASPSLVKQRYGTELRSRTLASVKPEISQALDSLLDELHTSEEAKVMRTAFSNSGKPPQIPSHRSPSYQQLHPSKPKPAYRTRPTKSCTLCFQAGRPDYRSHFVSTCPYLPESDRWFMSKVRHVADIDDTPDYEENAPDDDDFPSSAPPPHLIVTITRPAIPQHVVSILHSLHISTSSSMNILFVSR